MLTKQGVKTEDDYCKSVSDHDFGSSYVFKTCYLDGSIPKDFSTLMVLKKDFSVPGMRYYSTDFRPYGLPEGIGVKFSYLKGYQVSFCGIDKISMTHFNGMRRLRILIFRANIITSIMTGTFKELTALEHLDLCEYFF
jgi:Leucine rich repeat